MHKKKTGPNSKNRLGRIDIYNYFIDQNPDTDIDYKTFVNMITDCNNIFVNSIVEDGEDLHMGHNLSLIGVRKIPRNHKRKVINWGKTNKLACNQGGKGTYKKLVYFTDDEYCRIYWNKSAVRIPNRTVYRFNPVKAFKLKFKSHLKDDPFATLNYKPVYNG